ncbi:MAG TPA: hypothetical protein VK893_06255, partial [Pyrinomonadaceae bacterium]|nr:hypothetical protein [Pyrinomonadaceae bacterium]
GTAVQNFNISNNGTVGDPFAGAFSSAIVLNASNNSTMSGTINNNVIGNAAVANSGSFSGSGIAVTSNNTSDITVAITNNLIRQYSNPNGININVRDGLTNTTNATITGNTISNPGTFASNGILAQAGAAGGDAGFLCIDIGGAGALANTLGGSGANGSEDFRVRQRFSTTVRLPGYAGGNTDTAAVVAFIQGRNTGAETGSATVQAPGGGFVGGAACATAFVAANKAQLTNQQDQVAQTNTPEPSKVSAESVETRKPAPIASESFAQHAKKAKRDTGAVASYSRNNSWMGSSSVRAVQDKSRSKVKVSRAQDTPAALAGETVMHSVGTLLAGKTVHIQFQVTVNVPYAGGEFVSNQGTVSGDDFTDVLTDDPAVGGAADPTLTPIFPTPTVSVADAQANEPASGSTPMLFTISLSTPAPVGGSSVTYATADEAPGAGHAVAGVDYTAVPATVLNFAAGEQFKTVSVSILADGAGPEPDETFLLNLTSPVNAELGDAQAVGTIKQGNAAGTLLISEFRTSGPGGAGDDFVEVYNNSDSPLIVAASDASSGYGLFKMGADCSATPVLIGVIPNGTVIPARGHFLFVGSAYSLSNYGGTGAAAGDLTLSEDIESDRNVGIFTTSSVAGLSSVTRLDAVGFGSNTGGNCDLLREGATLTPLSGSVLEHSYFRDECGKKGNPAIFGPCPSAFGVMDANNNVDDFIFADTAATSTPAGQRLGSPGPQNLASAIVRNSTITALLLDSNIGAPAPPNRVRDFTPGTNAAFGTLSIRRRFVNNTGAPVTRLRFRIVDISTTMLPGPGFADVRALTSSNVTVNGVSDAGTCTAAGAGAPPCTVTVIGTTLEQPPTQALGGGWNSSLSAGTITLGTPLANGASINLQFLLGVQQTGSFKFFFNVEALP